MAVSSGHDARVASVFRSHDYDSSGRLSKVELAAALEELGVRLSTTEVAQLLSKVESSELDLRAFASLFSLGRLRAAFTEVDTSGDGLIDEKELRAALRNLGCGAVAQPTVRAMMSSVDVNGSGTIDFDEFVEAFEFVPLADLRSIAAAWEAVGQLDECPRQIPGLSVWQTVVAGGVSGVAARTVVAPIERVRLAAQVSRVEGFSAWRELARVFRTEGVRGLFAGNIVNCIRLFPTGAIVCTVYNELTALAPIRADRVDWFEPLYRLSAAALAAAFGNTLTYPLDSLRARLTVNGGSLVANVSKALSDAAHLRALFRGLAPALLCVVPFMAVQNTTIDVCKHVAAVRDIPVTPTFLAACGAAAGLAAQLVVHPLDNVRRRVQVADYDASTSWWRVLRAASFRSLYAGVGPTLVRTVPAVATWSLVCGGLVAHFKRANAER